MKTFDEVAENYDTEMQEMLGDNPEKYIEYKVQFIRSFINRQDGKFLDFGCGTGRSFEYIKKYFSRCQVYGCDVSEGSLEVASRMIPRENLFINDSGAAIKEHGKYDIVLASCVFHHIPHNERVDWIEAVVDSLSEDGYFFIFEHNILNPMTKKIILAENNKIDDITWMMTHKELKNIILESENSEIVWSGYTLFSPWRIRGILFIEKFLKAIPLGAQQCYVIRKKRIE